MVHPTFVKNTKILVLFQGVSLTAEYQAVCVSANLDIYQHFIDLLTFETLFYLRTILIIQIYIFQERCLQKKGIKIKMYTLTKCPVTIITKRIWYHQYTQVLLF